MDEIKHGSVSAHRYHGCRCDICVEAKRARDRDYYERNKDKVKAQVKRYKEANPEKVREWEKRHQTPEQLAKRRAFFLQYQKDNAELVNAKNRRWRQKNRWKAWFYNWRAREEKRGQVYDPDTLEWIKSLGGSECTYCGAEAETIDHKLPRSKGGTNHRENLTPACHRCNRRKGAMSVEDFLRRLREDGDLKERDG